MRLRSGRVKSGRLDSNRFQVKFYRYPEISDGDRKFTKIYENRRIFPKTIEISRKSTKTRWNCQIFPKIAEDRLSKKKTEVKRRLSKIIDYLRNFFNIHFYRNYCIKSKHFCSLLLLSSFFFNTINNYYFSSIEVKDTQFFFPIPLFLTFFFYL